MLGPSVTNFQFGPVVFGKRIFKVFHIHIDIYIGKQAPPPGSHIFIKTIDMKLRYHQEDMEESGKYKIAFLHGNSLHEAV